MVKGEIRPGSGKFLVGLPDFKSGVLGKSLIGGFDSHPLPPFFKRSYAERS